MGDIITILGQLARDSSVKLYLQKYPIIDLLLYLYYQETKDSGLKRQVETNI